MNKSIALYKHGQSIWFDNIDRSMLKNGWFADQVNQKTFVGVTSNPSIFQNAISHGGSYTLDIQTMAWSGLGTKEIYENLVIADIQSAADLMQPIYTETNGKDGYVSLEVNPLLADETDATISEAKRLWKTVGRDNLMIKIPATIAGISAIKTVISEGINVNVTLIFSTERYMEVIDAYFAGLEDRLSKHFPIDGIRSVASFFISRMDVMVEDLVGQMKLSKEDRVDLENKVLGKIGIYNAFNAYAAFEESIQSARFQKIAEAGGNIQRPLWASTGTKNEVYSDVLYVDQMILPDTVNTVPPKTLEVWLDHGSIEVITKKSFTEDFQQSVKVLTELEIDLDVIFEDLEKEGVQKFASSQESLFATIENERQRFITQLGMPMGRISQRLAEIEENQFVERFYQPDVSLFTTQTDEEQEVLNRLGWINAPDNSRSVVEDGENLLANLLDEGFSHAVVLGMGGSSLAPEVFSQVFMDQTGIKKQGLSVSILDSTDPEQIIEKLNSIPLRKTLFIASSKSGTTVEMKSLVAYFMDQLIKDGEKDPGKQFICITDPKTTLENFAVEHNFRRVFNADDTVGGRYSALIAFGIIPAILAGIDGYALLDSAASMRDKCGSDIAIRQNPAFVLAAILFEAYSMGHDKLTIIADERFQSFGSWLEQLIAESSGKNEKGLVPVDQEPMVDDSQYSSDRLFYYLRFDGKYDSFMTSLQNLGFTVLTSSLLNEYDIAGEMYKWEVAVAGLCCMIGVNPFNQPNVQASKAMATKLIEEFRTSDAVKSDNLLFENDVFSIFSSSISTDEIISDTKLLQTLFELNEGDFFAINAFLPRISHYEKALYTFRKSLLEEFFIPVTLGFGPRFLHSTGQLHKGGKNNGLFIVLTQDPKIDMEIPGEGIHFSTLEKAQAIGDIQALESHGRKVVRVHFKTRVEIKALNQLM